MENALLYTEESKKSTSLPIVLYQYVEETELVKEYSKVQCAINLMVDETHSYYGA